MIDEVGDIGCLYPEFGVSKQYPPLTRAPWCKVDLVVNQYVSLNLSRDLNRAHSMEMQ